MIDTPSRRTVPWLAQRQRTFEDTESCNMRKDKSGSWQPENDRHLEDETNKSELENAKLIEPYFDKEWYLEIYSDVKSSGMDPILHFLRYGDLERRNPSPFFCTTCYILKNPEITQEKICSLVHWVKEGIPNGIAADAVRYEDWAPHNVFIIETITKEFDVDWYAAHNPDVREGEEILHYAKYGWLEGRDPGPNFSTMGYLAANEDVREAKINPFVHWINEGRKEGRQFASQAVESGDLSHQLSVMRPLFDSEYYSAMWRFYESKTGTEDSGGEIQAETPDGWLLHFATSGWKQGLNPNREFSTSGYLSIYDDVRSAGINPFYHWIVQGIEEGRQAKPQTDYRCSIIASIQQPESRRAEIVKQRQSEESALLQLHDLLPHLDKRRTVATISHDDFTSHIGGIQLILRRESKNYQALGLNHIHFFPRCHSLIFTHDNDPVLGVLLNGDFLGWINGAEIGLELWNVNKNDRLRNPIDCISLVTHSFLGHRPDTIENLIDILDPKSKIFWVHDYASVCSGFQLLRNDVEWCGAPDITSSACQVCVYSDTRSLQYEAHKNILSNQRFDAVAPSRKAAEIFKRQYPSINIAVKEHIVLKAANVEPRKPGPIRIAFLGHPAAHKGWYEFLQLADTFAGDPRISFLHVSSGSAIAPSLVHIHAVPEANGDSAFPDIVRRESIDFAFVGSIWPETFCLIAYEAVAGGAQLITYKISGNVPDFVSSNHGYTVDNLDEAENLIATILDNGQPSKRQLYAIERTTAKTIEELYPPRNIRGKTNIKWQSE